MEVTLKARRITLHCQSCGRAFRYLYTVGPYRSQCPTCKKSKIVVKKGNKVK